MNELVDQLKKKGLNEIQVKNFINTIQSLDINKFETFKKLLNIYPRPTFSDVENYRKNHHNKVIINNLDYGGLDDLVCGIINDLTVNTDLKVAYERLIPYLNLVLRYEDEEKKHTHKGAIFFNIGQYFLRMAKFEEALLFLHRGLKEDHMKHVGTENFPRVWSYQIIILDRNLGHQLIKHISNFIEKTFLIPNYCYQEFYNNFLNKPSIIPNNELEWLDHISFFNQFIIRLERYYNLPEDLYNSILGEIKLSNLIGELCLLIESICKLKLGIKGTFSKIYDELNKQYSWKNKYINSNDFKDANLGNTLNQIFKNSYNSSIDPLENSFYLSWGLRNQIHHIINSKEIIRENFKEIIKKQMNFFLDFVINK